MENGYSASCTEAELEQCHRPPRVLVRREPEVRRLEALGVKRLEQRGDFWRMVDPEGSSSA